MNASHLLTLLDSAAGRVVPVGLNWFLQSSVLIGAGLLVARLLRAQGSAVQSAIYRTTLAAVKGSDRG